MQQSVTRQPLDKAANSRKMSWRTRAAVVASLAAVAGTVYAARESAPAGAAIAPATTATAGKLPHMFLIGTWEQPTNSDVHGTSNFAYWKSLGINTLVEIPQTQEYSSVANAHAWDVAASNAGLWVMRRPIGDNPGADPGKSQSNMIAWNLPDEPDKVDPPAHMTTAQIASFYKADKAANSTRPVYLSLVGGGLAGGYSIAPCSSSSSVACNAKGLAAYAQWLSADDYPVDAGRANPITMIGREMDGLWKVGSHTAARMAFIETGHIGSTTHKTVTAPQMKAEIWEAVVHGARGIIYFSDTTPSTKNDLGQLITPVSTYDNSISAKGGQPGVPAMMKSQNALLTNLQAALAGAINPNGVSVSVPAPLDAGWRTTSAGVKYFIVVNTSGSTLTKALKFSGVGVNKSATVQSENRSVWINSSGSATDTFKPYSVHIYQVR